VCHFRGPRYRAFLFPALAVLMDFYVRFLFDENLSVALTAWAETALLFDVLDARTVDLCGIRQARITR
jgi:hypothetical protein